MYNILSLLIRKTNQLLEKPSRYKRTHDFNRGILQK